MKKNNIFWISYSDLMTSLFFIMLVLFVITIGYLNSIIEKTQEEKEKLEELQTAIQKLPVEYFEYQPKFKRFKLRQQIQFGIGDYTINEDYYPYLIEVGKSILNLIDSLKSNIKYKEYDIKYLVVVEGMASRDNYPYNFELSYQRSLALHNLWKSNGIIFNQQDCELQISGSGIEGIREYFGLNEHRNQQFLIHIIPKIGKISENSEK